ncbi:hypothetical protein CS063_12215 [Sporanaerobium hydrogeniformans]|uniref:Uncharacterized protein n=1 Tax=Sporanaerobium hydrogeniformans TaxID=3072179 RepID=A0AC61DBB6_9FIRM|nr:hypothetical protein [Sporanaerobium hydrogeniformans]PHV70063.1 hypothetical protein CS063_12215 [Sporanaerobium hydrogeniformans]
MLFKKHTRSKLISADTLFNETTLDWLIVLVTIFLQVISLATTFEGSKVYFGGVKLPFFLSAPLLFSLAIQLTVFCTSHTIKRYFKAGLILVLLLATLCSTYFSYIGIYSHINSPISYLEERYSQIYSNLSEKYEALREESQNTMKGYVFDFVSSLDHSYAALTLQTEENATLNKKINAIEVNGGKINAQTNALQKPNKASFGDDLDAYYDAMAKYNAALGTMVSDTTKQDAALKNELYENEVRVVLGGKTKEEFTAQSIATTTKKEQIEKLIHSMYSLTSSPTSELTPSEELQAIQEHTLNFILKQEEGSHFSTLLTQLYTGLELLELQDKYPTFKEDLMEFTTLMSKDTQLMQPLDTVKKQVYEIAHGSSTTSPPLLTEEDAMPLYTALQSELKNAAYLLNGLNRLEKPIDLTDSTYAMHNLYVLPIKNLLENGSSKVMSWFALSFAILVDGLTLVFALMNAKAKTPLFAKRNKDIIGHSKEAMEGLLLSTIKATSPKESSLSENIQVLHYLESFISPFKLFAPSLNSGYSMWCNLSQLEEHHSFLAILCQFNLASIVSAEELEEVIPTSTKERYVLIKTKLIIWMNEQIAELKEPKQTYLPHPILEKGYVLKEDKS